MKKLLVFIFSLLFLIGFVEAKELDVKITKNDNNITLSWNKEENDSFEIYRSTKKNSNYKLIGTTDSSEYTDNNLTYGKTYYYKIKDKSNTSKVVYKKIKPNSVKNFNIVSVGSKNIKLSWDKENVKGYEVYRSTNKKKWTKVSTTKSTSINNKKLKINKTYYYKIRSYVLVKGKKVYSSFSDIISAKTYKVTSTFTKALDNAKDYIKSFACSKKELLSKLNVNSLIEKYVLSKLDVNFKENALKTANKYMSLFSLKKDELIKALKEYDGFTDEEVEYAINNIKTSFGEMTSSIETKYMKDLSILGYSKEEIEEIIKSFSVKDIKKYLLSKKYKNLLGFKSSDYFDITKLERYQNYFNKNKYSEKDAVLYTEIGLDKDFYTNMKPSNVSDGKLILVNKYNYIKKNYNANLEKLGKGYGNGSMNKEAAKHFRKMVDAAKKDGIKLKSVSAYRSYNSQKSLYNSYVRRDGKKKADTYSARPGHSEHNTGLAVDINTASSSAHFENTKAYKWLINNSYKYGFALRYLKGKEFITGYKYEPWHYRYFGEEVATKLHDMNVTYEEYLVMTKNK